MRKPIILLAGLSTFFSVSEFGIATAIGTAAVRTGVVVLNAATGPTPPATAGQLTADFSAMIVKNAALYDEQLLLEADGYVYSEPTDVVSPYAARKHSQRCIYAAWWWPRQSLAGA